MQVRIAELIGGLSLATDMGAGLPLQSAITGTLIATRMARRLRLPELEQKATYYAAILRFIGCSATAPEAASIGAGDDMSLMYALGMCDFAQPSEVADALERYWAPKADPHIRREIIRSLSEDITPVAQAAMFHCAQAVVLSRRFPVGDSVPRLLGHMYDRFDGIGSSMSGTDIPMPARLCGLAGDTAITLRALGKDAALEVVRGRRGGQFCPECADVIDRDHAEIFADLDAPSCWEAYLAEEPGSWQELSVADLDRACTAYGDYGDQRSAFLLGHSRHVARTTFLATEALGLAAEKRTSLRLSALLHDVGRAGVASGLWDKPGALSAHERRLVESHSEHTETVLRLAPNLRELVEPASHVHSRADGSGYPRTALDDLATGVLAASDMHEALTHDRPWRRAHAPDEASNLLLAEAKAGRLPGRAVAAVLDAAGHGKHTRSAAYPAGLTEREVEVLALLAQGLSNKQIADRLDISAKTAENHVGHIYEKTGARGRAAAALFAVEHDLHE